MRMRRRKPETATNNDQKLHHQDLTELNLIYIENLYLCTIYVMKLARNPITMFIFVFVSSDLSNNQIEELPQGIFSDLFRLEKL